MIMDIFSFLVVLLPIFIIILLPIILKTIKIIKEYERGILFTFGKYTKLLNPGLNILIPFVQTVKIVDLRIQTSDIPTQTTITKDNISIMVNGVVYYRVIDPEKAVLKINDYSYAVSNYAQTILRDVVSGITLDELLEKREWVASEIRRLVDEKADQWGVDITDIKLQDIKLPSSMERAMAVQAEAERERRAIIIKSEGEKIAAKTYLEAAEMISKNKTALSLRILQTINDISKDPSQKFLFFIPMEIIEPFLERNKEKCKIVTSKQDNSDQKENTLENNENKKNLNDDIKEKLKKLGIE